MTLRWANACRCGRSSRGIMMRRASTSGIFQRGILAGILTGLTFVQSTAFAAGPLLIAYGGFNETMAPLWIGIERGLFHKHGVDIAVLQTRSGQIMMTTLATGGASLVWEAPSSAVSSSVAGMKLGCFAAGNSKLPRELIVRKGIESLEDLRGKTFGVQSIGGGAWLSTMVALDARSRPGQVQAQCTRDRRYRHPNPSHCVRQHRCRGTSVQLRRHCQACGRPLLGRRRSSEARLSGDCNVFSEGLAHRQHRNDDRARKRVDRVAPLHSRAWQQT